MRWLFTAARRLREQGVLGMNRRNAEYVLDHNARARYPLVDDKLRMHELCGRLGVPTPAVFAVVSSYARLRGLPGALAGHAEFVIKPARGSGGRGILVVAGRRGRGYLRHNGGRLTPDALRQHVSDILSGMYSLGGRPDAALVQQRVRPHPAFAGVTHQGVPDVRVVVYRGEPAMAMLRLPTRESGGRANLHQGGIGAGVDLATGRTSHAVQRDRAVARHPDTGRPLVGVRVPSWAEVLGIARRVAGAVGLGYLGVDLVVDAAQGPLLLEANARPGLAIQIANGRGLLPRLREIDAQLDAAAAPAAASPADLPQSEELVRKSA
jgi:alpha-L-glutamate ligase-like protein